LWKFTFYENRGIRENVSKKKGKVKIMKIRTKALSIFLSSLLLLLPTISSAAKTTELKENTIIEQQKNMYVDYHLLKFEYESGELTAERKKESIIEVDLSHVKQKPVNLVANYNADYADLIEQQKNMDEDYHLLKSEYESGELTAKRKRELKFLLESKMNYFESTATQLLSSRYTEDKTKLQKKITDPYTDDSQNTDDFQIMADWLIYPTDETRYTGNYGSVTKYKSSDTAYYGHSYGNNTAYAEVVDTGNATIHNGWEFLAVVDYPEESFVVDELNIRHINAQGKAQCGSNAYANVKVSGVLYNQSTNTLMSQVTLDNATCLTGTFGSTDYLNVDNMRVNFTNWTLTYNNYYIVYVNTFADSGSAYAEVSSSYEYIEAIFY
jgi:hypothetical protein